MGLCRLSGLNASRATCHCSVQDTSNDLGAVPNAILGGTVIPGDFTVMHCGKPVLRRHAINARKLLMLNKQPQSELVHSFAPRRRREFLSIPTGRA